MKYWHTGFLSHDAEKAVSFFCSLPGVSREDWSIFEVCFEQNEMVVGNGGPLKVAMGRVGGIGYEIIQPLDDKSYHGEQLKKHGALLHHIAYVCEEDQQDAVRSMLADGGKIVWEAIHHGPEQDEHVYYIRSEKNGLIYELLNCCPFPL
jgi:hypothetical protein